MGSLTLKTAPAIMPITVEQLKGYIKKDSDEEDEVLTALLAGVVTFIEGQTGRTLAPAEFIFAFGPETDDDESHWRRVVRGEVIIPATPVREVTEYAYFDVDNVRQVIDEASYTVEESRGAVLFAKDYQVPPLADRDAPFEITFSAGYDAPAGGSGTGDDARLVLPPTAKALIFMLGEHWYSNRGTVDAGRNGVEVPHLMAAQALIQGLRVFRK